jgi:hypothetical protein
MWWYALAVATLCGVTKELTKLRGKTVTKLVTIDAKEVSSTVAAQHAFGYAAL